MIWSMEKNRDIILTSTIALKELSVTAKYCERLETLSGDKFNIFNILNIARKEEVLHSRLLCDLLNEAGSHGMGKIFLDLFTEKLKLQMASEPTRCIREMNIGVVNEDYSAGGKIDLLIETITGDPMIIIENKIDAIDQPKQLLRYKKYSADAHLLYLTLWGSKPSKDSSGDLEEGLDYKLVSYREDIIPWLEECRNAVKDKPRLNEILRQYIYVLKELTGLMNNNIMKEEVKKILEQHPEYIDALEQFQNSLNSIISDSHNKLKSALSIKYANKHISFNEEERILITFGEDADGFWIGYQLFQGENNISNSDRAVKLSSLLKLIIEERNSIFYSNDNFLGWFNPEPFEPRTKFLDHPKKMLLAFSNEDKMNALISSIYSQEEIITQNLIEKIN